MTASRARASTTTSAPVVVDLAAVEARLAGAGVPFERIAVGSSAVVVVSSYGGRVYGPFFDGGRSENWLPDAFASQSAFAGLLDGGDWNVGGDRLWVGPEIAYMIPDRADYWGSYAMPASLDPGRHTLSRRGDEATLHRTVELESFTAPAGSARVELRLRIRPAAHPLRHLRGAETVSPDVDYGGYTTEVRLALESDAAHEAESWVLNQVRGGGVALVAGSPGLQVTDYYEPVGALLRPVVGGVAVGLTGADRFKIGFAAPHVTGRIGHLSRVDGDVDGDVVLFVRSSPVDASAEYSEEPDPSPGVRGDALHLYDDDGGLGGFAEIEARGTPVLGPRPEPVTDRFTSWWFRGPVADVARIAQHLLGIPEEAVVASLLDPTPSRGTP